MLFCPQCGEDAEYLEQGYCMDCAASNQQELNKHNAQVDWWGSLTDEERAVEIRKQF